MSIDNFTFEISLSVLDHLGRNLYRSFATILGEAISNAWDANADNVWIEINKEDSSFFIKDDGYGMTASDFQHKFLKIGYSKRNEGNTSPDKGRRYIGRKGIGKLALLSCAEKITVISKVKGGSYIGGTIENAKLDMAITDDLTPQQYSLGAIDEKRIEEQSEDHEQGTIIYFEGIKDGIRNNLEFLRKITALYFRFSLRDQSFNIFIDGEKITHDDLAELAGKTQFVWNINGLVDPYIGENLTNLLEEEIQVVMDDEVEGFIASVEKPSDLNIYSTGFRAGVDLFVNGRLRENDILKHIPTARVAVNYFYGQIHFDGLDDEIDRFTSSREGIIADDPLYNNFLNMLRTHLNKIVSDWDRFRVKHRKDGDPENETIPKKERKSLELYQAVTVDYDLPKSDKNKSKVNEWVNDLSGDARFNLASYAECFVSENLVRKYLQEKNITLSPASQNTVAGWKSRETQSKAAGNVNIELRMDDDDLSYLDMAGLVIIADDPGVLNTLVRDGKEYRPIRDALMHTALLTAEAKRRLTSVYDNIKAGVKRLISAVAP